MIIMLKSSCTSLFAKCSYSMCNLISLLDIFLSRFQLNESNIVSHCFFLLISYLVTYLCCWHNKAKTLNYKQKDFLVTIEQVITETNRKVKDQMDFQGRMQVGHLCLFEPIRFDYHHLKLMLFSLSIRPSWPSPTFCTSATFCSRNTATSRPRQ